MPILRRIAELEEVYGKDAFGENGKPGARLKLVADQKTTDEAVDLLIALGKKIDQADVIADVLNIMLWAGQSLEALYRSSRQSCQKSVKFEWPNSKQAADFYRLAASLDHKAFQKLASLKK